MKARGSEPARTIEEAAISPEVRTALKHWGAAAGQVDYVLIGGLARAFHARPQFTDDIDVLFADETAMPDAVAGFRRESAGAFVDVETGVAVELYSARSVGVPASIAHRVLATAVDRDGIRCASLEGMIALRLRSARHRQRRLRDQQDIIDMLLWYPSFEPRGMRNWPLDLRARHMLARLHAIMRSER